MTPEKIQALEAIEQRLEEEEKRATKAYHNSVESYAGALGGKMPWGGTLQNVLNALTWLAAVKSQKALFNSLSKESNTQPASAT